MDQEIHLGVVFDSCTKNTHKINDETIKLSIETVMEANKLQINSYLRETSTFEN